VELEFHLYYLECGHILSTLVDSSECHDVPVNVFQKDNPSETHKLHAIIDDQSNRSLASPAFFDMFNILDKPENYTLATLVTHIVFLQYFFPLFYGIRPEASTFI
jgi:hypothetical protein